MRLFRPPPEFTDPAKLRTARIVYSVVGIVMALALGFLLVAVWILHEDTSHWVYSVGLGSAACLAILELNNRGRVRAAGILLVAMLWVQVTGFAALGGGLLAPITSGYLVLIFLAGFLLGARATWWTAALCGGTCLVFFAAEYAGWLPPGTEHHTIQAHGAILALMMLIVLGLQHLAARNVAARAANEAALRASEDKFRALFAAMRNVVLVLDGDGRLLEIAPTNPDPLYRPAPGWLGKTLAEVFPPELAAFFAEQIRLARAANQPHFFDYSLPLGDRVLWFTATLSPLPPGRLLLVARDITDRKQAEEALRRAQTDLEQRVQARTLELNRTNYALIGEVTERAAAESRLRAFAAALPDTAFIVDAEERFEEVLTATSPLPGIAPAALQGRPLADFFATGLAEAYHHVILRVLETGESQSIEYALPTADATRWFEGRAAPLLLGGGGRKLVVFVVRDITTRKQTEETLRKLSRAVEQSPTSIVITDREARIEYINARFTALTGYTPEEVLGRNPRVLNSGETPRETFRQMWTTILAGLEWRGEFNNRKKNGELYWEEAVVSPLKNNAGEITHFIAVKEDITPRKQAEQKLKAVLGELERSNRDLEQFAYIASHDLQEPLRLVSNFVQLLGQRYRGRLDADADQFIGFAVDGAQRMQTLIQDLLAYSRVGRENLPFVPVDCGAIMAQVVQTLSLAIREQHAAVTCDPLPTVSGDPTLLSQLFQNLVANALKFHRDEPPRVHVSAMPTEDKKAWQFAVRDNGIGIDAEFYERIFVIFQRLHGRSKYPGSGIGLSICKKIVELHGGRIWVDSVKNRGTVFSFTLPRTPTV